MNLYSSHLHSMETLLEGGTPVHRNNDLTPRLMVILGNEPGRTFPVAKGEFKVGRESSCEFMLNDPSVSRVHACLCRTESGDVLIEDLESRNGTFINDKRINQKTLIGHGDILRVGNVLLKFFEFGTLEAEVFQRVFEMALNDSLTETLTKSAICAQLDLMVQNHVGPVSIIMADLDHFKKVNDQYGHVTGDYVLHECVAVIKSAIIRPNDLIGRFGGEEFLIILPDTELAQAAALAETARVAVEKHVICRQDQKIQISVSLGVACRNLGDTVTITSTQNLLENADKALYQAKNQGRNKVISFI